METKYIYKNEFGKPIFCQSIIRYPDGDKKLQPQRYEKGKWKIGLVHKDEDGNSRWLVRKVLYNLPSLYRAKNTKKDMEQYEF